jgi:hypothetical protein
MPSIDQTVVDANAVPPFTAGQFFGVFRAYNETVWPAQLLLLLLAVTALGFAAFPRRWSGVGISAILAFLWAWMGLAYHLAFFAAINALAYVFSALSVIASGVFVWQGIVRRRLEFRFARSVRTAVGAVLVVFALAVYPVWSAYAGHNYPAMPTFGLPCPTAMFTIGLLALLVRPYPRSPLVMPLLWCLVGAQAAFLLGVPQDLSLLVAAAVGTVLIGRAPLPATVR